jgi:hypothetical protein
MPTPGWTSWKAWPVTVRTETRKAAAATLARVEAAVSRSGRDPDQARLDAVVRGSALVLHERGLAALHGVDASPDPWQRRLLLADPHRAMVVSSRQMGKSQTVAAFALHRAAFTPGRTVLVVCRSLEQSKLLLQKMSALIPWLGSAAAGVEATASAIRFPNKSLVLCLPGTGNAARGYSADLLVLDESAFAEESLWSALWPVVAATGGDVLLISSPGAPTGWFYDLWSRAGDGEDGWLRVRAVATEVPRLAASLEDARRTMTAAAFRREMLCEFVGSSSSFFDPLSVERLAARRADGAPQSAADLFLSLKGN